MPDLYIQTNKFYTIPRYEDYHLAKKGHLQAIDLQYDTKKTGAKWSFVIDQLSTSLNQQHMPGDLQVDAFQRDLAVFKTKRVGTTASHYNLSLTQCVSYFEEFTFLYNTTNSPYTLTDAAKKDLLKSIHEAMDVCETGLNGQLYTALQRHQKESDWIQNELVKSRCTTLVLLYNAFGSAEVHGYNALVQMANHAQLGIPKKEEILDVHRGLVDFAKLEAFFNHNYPAFFATYEKQIERNLTNHYLSELATTLSINSADWANGPIELTFKQTEDITGSITAYFQGVDTELILPELGALSEDFKTYTLKSKSDVDNIIKKLVAQKLIADRYVVTLDEIAADRKEYRDLRLKEGVDLDELIKLHQALKEDALEAVQDKLQRNPLILMRYPELITNQIKDKPAILSMVPQWLKADTRFVDSSMVILDQLLCQAILEENQEAIRRLTTQVLNFIRSEYGYLQQLSEPVLNHPIVAAMLVKKNRMLFFWLNQSLRDDPQLQAHVNPQELFSPYAPDRPIRDSDMVVEAIFNAQQFIKRQYPDVCFFAERTEDATPYKWTANFLRKKALIALLKPGELTLGEFFAHVNDLNPALLLYVIRHRKTKNLPPLPVFDKEKTCKNLEKFNLELTTGLSPDWSQDYLSIKRRACQQENFAFIRNPFALKNAVTYLSKTDNWFAGFKQYYVYQSSNERLWARLVIMMHAFQRVIVSIIKIGLSVAILYYVVPFLSAIISMYYWQGLLTVFTVWLLNEVLQSRLVGTINDIIWRGLSFDFELYLAGIGIIIDQFMLIFAALAEAVDGAYALLEVITNAFSYLTSTHRNEHLADTVEDTPDGEFRLNGPPDRALFFRSRTTADELLETVEDSHEVSFNRPDI